MSQTRISRPVAMLATSALLFGLFGSFALTQDDPNRGFFYRLDSRIVRSLHPHQLEHPHLTAFFRYYGHIIGTWGVLAVAAAGSAMLIYRREHHLAVTWWLALLGIWGFNELLKMLFQSPRPDFAQERSFGYPSGHAVRSLMGYGFLAYILILKLPRVWQKCSAVAGLALLVLGVGFSRIYLSSHFLTDVLGGYAISGCVLVLVIWGVEARRDRLRLAAEASEALTSAPSTAPPLADAHASDCPNPQSR